MKKQNRIILLLLSVLIVFSLASCARDKAKETETAEKPFEPTDAVSLWNKVDETMTALDSYKESSEVKMTYYFMGNKFDVSGTGISVHCEKEGSFYSYRDGKTEIVCEQQSVNEVSEYMKAYVDGKMYIFNKLGDYEQKFCSEITAEEFKESENEDLAENVDFTDCIKADFSKKEDGSWQIEFTGYTKKTVNALVENTGMTDENFGEDILDMNVLVTADASFRATKLEIEFIFDVKDDTTVAPEFSAIASYSDFNTVKENSNEINFESFKQVEDAHILEDVADGIEKIKNASKGKFSFESDLTYKILGQTQTVTEKDTVSYGVENGSYYYDIEVDSEGEKYSLTYRGGVQTITALGSESESVSQSQEEAKMTIDSLIDPITYNSITVTEIEKIEEGSYLLKISKPEDSSYREAFESMDMEYVSATEEIVVNLVDGEISSITTKAIAGGKYSGGGVSEAATLIIETKVTFESISEETTA